jgi:hypothetical protein
LAPPRPSGRMSECRDSNRPDAAEGVSGNSISGLNENADRKVQQASLVLRFHLTWQP